MSQFEKWWEAKRATMSDQGRLIWAGPPALARECWNACAAEAERLCREREQQAGSASDCRRDIAKLAEVDR
jgi:hypothetical protein